MEWVILVAGILGKFPHEPVRLSSTILIEFKIHTLHWSIFISHTQFTSYITIFLSLQNVMSYTVEVKILSLSTSEHKPYSGSPCTMHSLQSKCTCELFGQPLGLNL